MTQKLILMLIMTLALKSISKAQSWTEDYGPFQPGQTDDISTVFDEDYRWLYELILPEFARVQLPKESFKSFRVHLKDTYQIFPKPSDLNFKNLSFVQQVQGKMTYAGIFRKKYIYDVLISPSKMLILNVRIHLKEPTPTDIIDFTQKVSDAQNLWNNGRIQTNFNYAFKFDITSDITRAHFSVNLQDTTRGPYDTNWGRDWTANVVAHEIGHMLGLGDEYQTISGQFDCLKSSLMCTAWSGSLMEHNYYFVLRRLMK